MTRSIPLRRALAALALATTCGLSHATLSFGWSLLEWQPVLGPTDTLVLRAQLVNEPSSTENLLGSRFLARVAEDIEDVYAFSEAVPSLAEQFKDLDLEPGEGVDFVFGLYVPKAGSVAPGSYWGSGLSLSFSEAGGRERSWTPDRTLIVTVDDRGIPGGTVPEPAGLALLALAAAATVRRFKPSSRPCR